MVSGKIMTTKHDSHPDKKLTAAYGLFCPACTLFIGTAENDPKRLEAVSKVYDPPPPPRYGNVTDAGRKSGAISVKMNAKQKRMPP